jgi:hypothetical protein
MRNGSDAHTTVGVGGEREGGLVELEGTCRPLGRRTHGVRFEHDETIDE